MPTGAREARRARAAQRRAEWNERAAYHPLDVPKPIAPGVWVVDGAPIHPMGSPMPLPLRMTVVRLPSGGLLLHSPTQYSAALAEALEAIGPVRDIVAPNVAHWMTLHDWQAALPRARLWAAPNLLRRGPVRRAKLRWDGELTPVLPTEWQPVLQHVILAGGLGYREVAFLHTPSRTALLTDLVLNLEPRRIPAFMRGAARALGVTAPDGRAPIYLRGVVRAGGAAARQAAEQIVAWQPQRVVFAHGTMLEQNAAAALAHSLRWLLQD